MYLVISALAVGGGMTYSWINGLSVWQTVALVSGSLIGACATLFTFLELFRIAEPAKATDEAFKNEPDPYAPETIVVEPPTGEPYPHHEDHVESAGFDQGQLTSRLNESTPLIDTLMSRLPKEKQKATR